MVLESTKPFTIHDIDVTSTIDEALDVNDYARLNYIEIMSSSYASTENGVNDALNDDDETLTLCYNCGEYVMRGDRTISSGTLSCQTIENDNGDASGGTTFGPNQKIIVELYHYENDGSVGDISSQVTFYLSGVTVSDVTVTTLQDVPG